MKNHFTHVQPPCNPLVVEDFDRFYRAIHGYDPFQWQSRLARQVCRGEWPKYLKLPTASGKTAAIEVAVFALAFQAADVNRPNGVMTAARRIFFVVDRRIVVNEAFEQTKKTAELLRAAIDPETTNTGSLQNTDSELLVHVARWLQYLSGDQSAPPLDCFELRGGIYRDDAWVRSPLQPTVLASTVDQVGSRLMFRGYGVTDRNLSIHAGLTANDSLIILDEAHCSKPFSQSIESVTRYRSERWSAETIRTPFSFVQMTATPPPGLSENELFQLTDGDYQRDELLEQRHGCQKEVSLELATGAKGSKLVAALAKKMVVKANELNQEYGSRKIAVVVNRVDLARAAFSLLQSQHAERVELMIGRMRPLDRDKLTDELKQGFGSGWTKNARGQGDSIEESRPQFVVATQCLEVGADLDFDGMVSQCASLDALRQRFGRLNRLGDSPNARGVIIAAEADIQPIEKLNDDKPLDRIYGNALARTWHWLKSSAETRPTDEPSMPVVDFGIKAMDASISTIGAEELRILLAPTLNAPVLMPAHVDMLCQTSPRPTPEPDVAAYLHGVDPDSDRDRTEVRVCWRADLNLDLSMRQIKDVAEDWAKAVGVCPPSTAECLSVPLSHFRKWLKGERIVDDTGDVLGEAVETNVDRRKKYGIDRTVLVWRGQVKKDDESKSSYCVTGWSTGKIRPNDTIVIPAEFGGWDALGHVPNAPVDPSEHDDDSYAWKDFLVDQISRIDVADKAFLQSRAQSILRVHPKLVPIAQVSELFGRLLNAAEDLESDLRLSYWQEIAMSLDVDETDSVDAEVDSTPFEEQLREQLINSKGQLVRYPGGIAWITQRPKSYRLGILPFPSFGDDGDSLSLAEKLPLSQHLADVAFEADRLTTVLSLSDPFRSALLESAKTHDLGKSDPRFQAMLIDKPVSVAYMQPQLWAKSSGTGRTASQYLPAGFRHEMLSLDLLDHIDRSESADFELWKHLVGSHHGRARPFATICIDEELPALNLQRIGLSEISEGERSSWKPAHRLDSGIADRFWTMNRRYGWWGLAYLESLLRMADWRASANSGFGSPEQLLLSPSSQPLNIKTNNCVSGSIVLNGLDGSNPLAFLTALGALRAISSASPDASFQLSWRLYEGAWRPVISSKVIGEITQNMLLDLLESLAMKPEEHPSLRLSRMVDEKGMRETFIQVAFESQLDSRSDADWLSCNGSDVADPGSISQLQTTRRDYHAINIEGLITQTSRDHLWRSLFGKWDYSDPIAGVSLHLEPREDRRHAYQWHMPSGDPTRKVFGGMIGANRLALEAWPLFQSLPANGKLTTVGFKGTKANDTEFTWPIWTTPVEMSTLTSILSLNEIQSSSIDESILKHVGIEAVFRCERILVGKTPNLTSPAAVLC